MNPGDGDGTPSRVTRKLRAHAPALTKALALLVALAGVRCSGADDDDIDFDDAAGQSSLPAGTGGSAGLSGGVAGASPVAGMTQAIGGVSGAAGAAGTSGKSGDGGSSGERSAGSGGSSAAAGRGGADTGGRGGRGGRGGGSGGGTAGASDAGNAGTSGMGGSGQSWDIAGTLQAHNAVRAMVAMGDALPALTWSDALASVAQDWADTLADECDGIRHRMPNEYGENIAAQWFFGAAPSPSAERYGPEAVAAWADEIECWEYGTISGTEMCNQQCVQMQSSSGCGHYTQLVWRKTERVGCGYATCNPPDGDLMEIFVCNYDPPGNVQRQAPY